MLVLCCSCGVHLATKEGKGVRGSSHGMCPTCKDRLLLRTFLDRRKDRSDAGRGPGSRSWAGKPLH